MPPANPIVSCKIHPAIGIARVGNSRDPDGFFVGPESPLVNEPPPGGYKKGVDTPVAPAAVKRQAARFRVFGYDAQGKVVRELTAPEVDIRWTVRLTNKKAEWHRFDGSNGETTPHTLSRRNRTVAARADLIISSPEQVVNLGNRKADLVGTLRVVQPAIRVELGEIWMEDTGRLLVLGGFGRSESWNGSLIQHYANNDGWFDDSSDGPVVAEVTLAGQRLPVAPAWVIVGPPDFAPAIPNVVTLYDVAYEAAALRGWLPKSSDPGFQVSFEDHVWPILSRVLAMQWVSLDGLLGHGPGGKGDFLKIKATLSDNKPAARQARQKVFSFIRNPNLADSDPDAIDQASETFMPPLSGDEGDVSEGNFSTWLKLTKTQYEIMRRWAGGDFQPGGAVPPTGITTEGLDRAALEACAGGAFFPGIEASWILRRPTVYAEAFRIAHDYVDEVDPVHARLEAGDITKYSALPWQADFYECRLNWWPAQRPDNVLTRASFQRVAQLDAELATLDPSSPEFQQKRRERDRAWRTRPLWTRSFNPRARPEGDTDMVNNWHRLGFVVDRDENGSALVLGGQAQFVEIGRDPSLPET